MILPDYQYIYIYYCSICSQIVLALRQYGLSASDDMEMVTQVKNEVKKLCTKKNISLHITLNEEAEKKRKDKEEMIAKNKKVIVSKYCITVLFYTKS